jgi:DNA cross-link repair 1A protein
MEEGPPPPPPPAPASNNRKEANEELKDLKPRPSFPRPGPARGVGATSLTYNDRMEALRKYAAGKGGARRTHHTFGSVATKGEECETRYASLPLVAPALKPPQEKKTKYWGMWRSHVILGTPGPFAVDCFKGKQSATLHKEGTSSWFLSHYHYDHYIGLKKNFDKGQIYCTKITAKLVHHLLCVPLDVINIVTIGQPVVVEGVKVTPLNANHCPGACMFLFEPAGEVPTLHTGDCRLSGDKMQAMPELTKVRGNVKLILDTTYCNAKYTFPTQERVVEATVRIVCAELASNPRALVLVGSYTIGKEVVFLRIAEALGCKIYIGANKRRVVKCLDGYLSEHQRGLMTSNDMETNLHVVPMGQLSQQRTEAILKHYKNKYSGIVAIRPTGWSIDKEANTNNGNGNGNEGISSRKKGKVLTYSVPYSEHSGYDEMSAFVNWLQPKEIIPFVKIQDQDAFVNLLSIAASNRT